MWTRFFSIVAVMCTASAYGIYLHSVYISSTVPNPAAWTAWLVLVALNAVAFFEGSERDAVMAAQSIAEAIGCCLIFGFAITHARFGKMDTMGWVILGVCGIAMFVWQKKRNAIYGDAVLGIALIISFIPMIHGVIHGHTEHPLPWLVWSISFLLNFIIAFHRSNRSNKDWRWLLFTPGVSVFFHLTVMVTAWVLVGW